MTMKRIAVLLAFALTLGSLMLLAVQTGHAQGVTPGEAHWDDPALRTRCDPALLKALASAKPDDRIPIIVVMRDQAERATGAANAAASLAATAERSQAQVRSFLVQEQDAGRVDSVRSFWIFNGLALHAVQATVAALAARADVALLQLDQYRRWIPESELTARAQTRDPVAVRTGTATSAAQWGVQQVRADQVWAAFNITGTGVVVGNLDTGVDFLHPALNANYRGNTGKGMYQHAGSWFDATSDGSTYPTDGVGHGTHTMGIIAGQDGIGVAPGARWIAARVFDSAGNAYDSWVHAGFQWMLAPDGDPSRAPRVLSNSWGSADGSLTTFQADIARLQQAGVLVVFSAGNEGPGERTVNSPASLPGVLAVGATDAGDAVASFSSRGPSPWGQVKPDLVAPGVAIRSSIPGGATALESGTSMAAPHVAGAAALLLSAQPGLTISETRHALTSTVVALGQSVPNNNTGWGRLDAYRAMQTVAQAGTLSGAVLDAASHLPLSGARVVARNDDTGSEVVLYADSAGRYTTALAAGIYDLTASMFGYASATATMVPVTTGQTTTRNLTPAALPVGVLRGVLVEAQSGNPVTTTISALDTPIAQTAYGLYQFALPAGTYTIRERGMGYRVMTATVTIAAGQVTQQDFRLTAAPSVLLVNSGAWYYTDYTSYYSQALDQLSYAYDRLSIKTLPDDTPVVTDLLKYDLVIWSAPNDSPGYIGAGQTIGKYLAQGHKLLLSGQDVAYWDGGGSMSFSASYFSAYLKARYVADDSGSRSVAGQADDIMSGLSFNIEGGDGAGNQTSPDEIGVLEPDSASQVLSYTGDGSAGNRIGECLSYRAMLLPFGYEAISDAASRREVMNRAIAYLTGPRETEGLKLSPLSSQVQVGPPGTAAVFTARARNVGEAGGPVDYVAAASNASWATTVTPARLTLGACVSATITATVSIPPGTGSDVRSAFALNVQPASGPGPSQEVSLTAKTPAAVLLVDHDRWYDMQASYTSALAQAGITYDTWDVTGNGTAPAAGSPSAERLSWYPMVLWYTSYDWYKPVTADDEKQLSTYLDGGGRLMLSSAFYLDLRGQSAFARNYLGVLDYSYLYTATQSYGSPGHPLGVGLDDKVGLVNPFGRSGIPVLDGAVVPTRNASTAWRGDHNRAQAIATTGAGERTVLWTIPFEALPEAMRGVALGRTLGWLGPLGSSTVSVQPQVATIGQPVTIALVAANNTASSTQATMTATLPIGFALSDWSPGLAHGDGTAVFTWRGTLGGGQSATFVVHGVATQAIPDQAGDVVFRDERLGVSYELPLPLRADAPDLATSSLEVQPAHLSQPARVVLSLRNTGPQLASGAIVTALLPISSTVVANSIALEGPGSAQAWNAGVTWRGALESGQTATVSFAVETSAEQLTATPLPVEMLAWDGSGGAWEWRAWLDLMPEKRYFPFVFTKSR